MRLIYVQYRNANVGVWATISRSIRSLKAASMMLQVRLALRTAPNMTAQVLFRKECLHMSITMMLSCRIACNRKKWVYAL
ncbi:hypothetical protein M378DRAFT_636083 [Amanita muscaria Koide BX008]|uniref:Uncharacterized protein n=1 Tax=Amanita muscaria (strain Koide BX008) TaxID=946122 RepID=A0A0C2X4B8_AMAMK|nr:hypothetical protein M378DRAFT_636083 [Amanita muscaria Koide BX008]